MGLQIPFGKDDGRSSEMGLKMPSREHVDFTRYSFVGIPAPVVEEDSAEECQSLSWNIEF